MRRSFRVLAPACAAAAAAVITQSTCPSLSASALCEENPASINAKGSNNVKYLSRTEAFKAEIAKIRAIEKEMRVRWEEDEKGWHKLPARAWPEFQPNVGDIPGLRLAVEKECGSSGSTTSALGSADQSAEKDSFQQQQSKSCGVAKFDLATALLFNQVAPAEALALYRSLAEQENLVEPFPAGMTALGMCLTEGYGDQGRIYKEGSEWFRRAAALGYPQAVYELGVLFYTGAADPHVQESDQEAFRHFSWTADRQHSSGMFMTADMLLSLPPGLLLLLEKEEEEDAVTAAAAALPTETQTQTQGDTNVSNINDNSIDVALRGHARAVRLLYAAGNKGHRQARQQLFELLRDEKKIVKQLEQEEKQ